MNPSLLYSFQISTLAEHRYDDTTQTQLLIENVKTHSVTHYCPYLIGSIGSVSIVVEAEDWIFIPLLVSALRNLDMKVTESRRGKHEDVEYAVTRPCFQKRVDDSFMKELQNVHKICDFVKQMNFHFISMELFFVKIQNVNSTVIAI